MKTKALLILGVIFSFLFSAQAEDVNITEQLDSIVTISVDDEEIEKELFIWNEQGLLEKHTTSGFTLDWEGNPQPFSTVIDYVYDEFKQVTQKATEATNQYGTTSEIIDYVYNELKQLIQKTTASTYSWGSQTLKIEYKYDENGVVNEVINSADYGTGWVNTGKTVTTRDSDGLLQDSTIYYYSANNWLISDQIIKRYDEEKRLESVEAYTPNFMTKVLVLLTKETYTYDTTDEGHILRSGLAQMHTDDMLEPIDEPTDEWTDEQISNAAGLVLSYEKKASWGGIEKYTTTQFVNMFGTTFTTRTNYSWPFGKTEWSVSTVIEDAVPSPTAWSKTITHTEKKPNPAYDPEDETGMSQEFLKTSELSYSYGTGTTLVSQKSSVWTDDVESTEEFIYNCDEEVEISQVYILELFSQKPYFFTNKPTTIRKYKGSGFNTSLVETATFHYSDINGSAIAPTLVKNNNTKAYFVEGTLKVETPNVETISVYSLSGSLLYTVNKAEGAASFDLALAQGIFIIKGSTGWAVKAIK